MPGKSLKGRLFRILGPHAYRLIHAAWFFIRLQVAMRSQRYAASFFGRDLSAFAARLKPGDRVLDIGAFLGASTIQFGKAVGKSGRVLAFEPVHHNFLKAILRPFRLPQVSLMPVALAAENGSTDFLIPIHNGVPLYSQSGFPAAYAEVRASSGYTFLKLRTPLVRLDDFMLNQGLTPESVAAVKIDVEGSEMSVFAGGEEFFRGFGGLIMCEFWFNQVPPRGWSWLRERGYGCRYLGKDGAWVSADSVEAITAICRGETYGNFFWEKPSA